MYSTSDSPDTAHRTSECYDIIVPHSYTIVWTGLLLLLNEQRWRNPRTYIKRNGRRAPTCSKAFLQVDVFFFLWIPLSLFISNSSSGPTHLMIHECGTTMLPYSVFAFSSIPSQSCFSLYCRWKRTSRSSLIRFSVSLEPNFQV